MLFHYLRGVLAISSTLLLQLPCQNGTLRIQKPFEWGGARHPSAVVEMGRGEGELVRGLGNGSGRGWGSRLESWFG